jgi:hypothetical protein
VREPGVEPDAGGGDDEDTITTGLRSGRLDTVPR